MTSARSSCKDLLERILPGSPQDLLTRTSTRSCKSLVEDRSPQDLLFEDRFKITQGPLRGRLRDLHKIFLGQGPVTGFHQDLQNIFSQGPVQDLGQDFHMLRTSKTAPCNSCKIVIEESSREPGRSLSLRGSYGKCKCWWPGLDQGAPSGFRMKVSLWDVHMRFDRAGSHKMYAWVLALQKVSFY
jgi:hypothetical protein